MSLPKYPAYKDSGMEWFRNIPQHWEVWKLAHAFDYIGSGTTPKSENAEYYSDGDVFWLNTGDLNDGELFSCNKKISNLALLEHSALRIYPADSLAIAMYGATIGKLALLKFETTVNQACCVFGSSEIIRIEFLFYLLLGFRERIISLAIGGGQPNINQDILRSLKFPCPILDEQSLIVTFLDRETAKIDELIAEQEKLITLLEDKRKAMISHAVTKGLNPDAPMKDSGVEWLGEVPEHWDVRPLKNLVKMKSGGTPSKENLAFWDGEIPWASAKDLKVEKLLDTQDHITNLALEFGNAELLPKGSILVVVRGMILAKTFPVVEILVPMAINQDLKGLYSNLLLKNEFLAYLLKGSSKESLSRLDEAGHGTKALRMDKWTSMKLPVPPLDEQSAITFYLDQKTFQLDNLKIEAQRGIDLFKERRSALISAAVTGKIDVRGLV